MVYTEVKKQNGKKYFYRVRTIRNGKKFKKQRIYLGVDLSDEKKLSKEMEADEKLNIKKKFDKIKELIPVIVKILKKYGIKRAGIFGSYTRNEQTKKSDIDILIEYPKGLGGFGFVGIALDLEKALKKKVDLLTYGGINPYLKENILREEVKII